MTQFEGMGNTAREHVQVMKEHEGAQGVDFWGDKTMQSNVVMIQ